MDRRKFLKIGTTAAITTALLNNLSLTAATLKNENDKLGYVLPTRPFGKTGEKLTILGLGGYHIGIGDEKNAQRTIEKAIEEGIRFFDNANSYNSGLSEERFGRYLSPKFRDSVFIMTKSTAQSADRFEEHVQLSLKRMKIDYIDLMYIHSISTKEDVDKREKQGVFDKVRELKEKGFIRHIGVSCHTHPSVVLHFLDKIKDDDFITCVQAPLNIVDAGSPNNSFARDLSPELVKRNHSFIAMKSLGGGALMGGMMADFKDEKRRPEKYPIPELLTMEENFQFILSQPVTSLVSGMKNPEHVAQNAAVAKNFLEMTEDEKIALVKKVAARAYYTDRKMETYKRDLS